MLGLLTKHFVFSNVVEDIGITDHQIDMMKNYIS